MKLRFAIVLALTGMGWGQASLKCDPTHELAYGTSDARGGTRFWSCDKKSHKWIEDLDMERQIAACCESPKPEPIDVPAVKEPSKEGPNGPRCNFWPCEHKVTKWCSYTGEGGFDGQSLEVCEDHPPLVDTCTEKSRILLTAEDGSKHCIKFPTEPKP